jgi:glycosyltransferase involved in cell wall biosynthesis
MKILYIFTFDYSFKIWKETGILDREIEYFNRLKSKNVELTILTFGDGYDEDLLKDYNFKIYPIYKYFKKPRYKIFRILKSFAFPFFIKKNIDFDIVKQNQLQGSWIPIILKIITGKKLIIRTGYDVFLFSIKEKKAYFKRLLFYLLTQLSISFSNIYTVTSINDKEFLEKYFFVRKKTIQVRRNWVQHANKNTELNVRNEDCVISVGRLESQKNYRKLIDLLKGSSKKLLIFGNGSEKNLILEYAKRQGVEIEIRDPVQNTVLTNLMCNYKFYITTSLFEGNPKSILEAMGAGCIVVAPENDNNFEFIKNEFNGFLYDIDSTNNFDFIFTRHIEQLSMISNNAHETIKKHYSLENFLIQEVREFEEISI